MNSRTKPIFVILLCGLYFSFPVFAEEQKPAEQAAVLEADSEQTEEGDAVGEQDEPAAEVPAEIPAGILPIPVYGGEIGKRGYLTGDWGGKRTEWADHGIQFDLEWLQWDGAVVDGGLENKNRYGGTVTMNLEVDLMRAGIHPGSILQIRTESRYCCSTLFDVGAQAVPGNIAVLPPLNFSSLDGNEAIELVNLSYLHFLSAHVGVIIGKIDLFGDGDPNEFASGRGRTQFMNYNFNFAPQTLIVPASTLGGGVLYLPNQYWTISSMLFSGTDCTLGDCFEDLGDKGKISATSVTGQYSLGGKPGGVNAAYVYFFDKDFTNIDTIHVLPPPAGIQGSSKDHSWLANISFWQYLSVKEASEGPLDLHNRHADLQGWGLFGRLGFSDSETNPWNTSVAIGIGGRGVIPSRPSDEFGIGYFYNKINLARFLEVVGVNDSSQGVEAYYNLAITPAVGLTFDFQWLESIFPHIEDATVLHARLVMKF